MSQLEKITYIALIGGMALIVFLFVVYAYRELHSPPCKRYSEPRLVLTPTLIGKAVILQPHWLRDCEEREEREGAPQ